MHQINVIRFTQMNLFRTGAFNDVHVLTISLAIRGSEYRSLLHNGSCCRDQESDIKKYIQRETKVFMLDQNIICITMLWYSLSTMGVQFEQTYKHNVGEGLACTLSCHSHSQLPTLKKYPPKITPPPQPTTTKTKTYRLLQVISVYIFVVPMSI